MDGFFRCLSNRYWVHTRYGRAPIRGRICMDMTMVDLTDLPQVQVTDADRLDTGNPRDRVWTHDLLTLSQSPRLGAGLMVMENTTFPWHLTYDEIDYVIEGTLTVHTQSGSVTAGPGQVIFIPKGSQIQFSAPEYARFLYVTYPADWQNQPS